jgi:hypothetical protein
MDLWEEYFEIRRIEQQQGDAFAWRATQFYLDRYDAMRDGFLGTNPYRYNKEISPDGNPIEVDSLQACMNFICDNGREAFQSEYQNDPADGPGEDKRDILTARVIESRVNELEREQLLPNSLGSTLGLDIGKYYCHWAKIAWYPGNVGTIVNYGVVEVHGTSTTSTKQATERALLTALNCFYEQHAQADVIPSFMMVDSSDGVLKDSVYNFILQCPDSPISAVAAKGYGDRQAPNLNTDRDDRIVGRYWYAQLQPKEGVWLYHFDGNYWKRWVQERFRIECLLESGALAPSSLSLFRVSKARAHLPFGNHIVAEEWREVPSSRGLVRKFVSVNVNNHWLDATAMASAAAAMNGFIDVRDFAE